MMSQKRSLSGAEALFGAAFLYALTGILIRELAPMWGDNAQVAVRFSLAALMLFVYGFVKKQRFRIPKSYLVKVMALSILFALVVLFFTSAVGKTTIANSVFTYFASNLVLSFILGTVVFKEKITTYKLLAILLSLAGLSLYVNAVLTGSIGLLYGIIAGLCDGSANVFRKKLHGLSHSVVVFYQYFIGSIFAVLITVLSGQEILRHFSIQASLFTVIFAPILIFAAGLMLYGYQNFDVNIGTVIGSTELIFATVMAFVLFQEFPATHELVGGCLILTGAIFGSGVLNKKRQKIESAIDLVQK